MKPRFIHGRLLLGGFAPLSEGHRKPRYARTGTKDGKRMLRMVEPGLLICPFTTPT